MQLGKQLTPPKQPVVALAQPQQTATTQPAATASNISAQPQTPFQHFGNSFTGYGDGYGVNQNAAYMWLDPALQEKVKGDHKYAALVDDDSKTTTVGDFVKSMKRYRVETTPDELKNAGLEYANYHLYQGPHEGPDPQNDEKVYQYLTLEQAKKLNPSTKDEDLEKNSGYFMDGGGTAYGDEGVSIANDPMLGTKEKLLEQAGLKGVTDETAKIAFTAMETADGSVGEYGFTGTYNDGIDHNAGRSNRRSQQQDNKAYQAISDPKLKGLVQIGNIGPLNDDINTMLPEVYKQAGATTPAQQQNVRNMLFHYDERFGLMANKDFIKAAASKNNGRQNGWLQKNGQIIGAVVSMIPGGQVIGGAISAMTTLANGGSLGDVLKGIAASYAGAQVGGAVGGMTKGLGSSASAAAAAAARTATSGLISTGKLDPKSLLASAATAGLIQGGTNLSRGLDFNTSTTGADLSRLQRQGGLDTPNDYTKALISAGGQMAGQYIKTGGINANGLLASVAGTAANDSIGSLTGNGTLGDIAGTVASTAVKQMTLGKQLVPPKKITKKGG
jgi:hypothetical protein